MISVVVQVKRASHLTHEEFLDYWRNRHAPLVLSVPEFMRHVRRYTQFHSNTDANSAFFGSVSEFDGAAELWFDSAADAATAFAEPRYLELVKPDEETFVDLENCRTMITDPHVVWEGGLLYSLPRASDGNPLVRSYGEA